MRAKLYEVYELSRSSFWFLPMVMMAIALALFAGTLTLDEMGVGNGALTTLFYSGGVTNAGNLLQTLTGAMVAIAAVVFSTMMVVLTLATSQFGHRLIRSFMRDRANQAVLGIFLATFVYCMLVFFMLGNDPKNQFLPAVSLTVGFVLALFATCTLIYFTHHIAAQFSAPEVLETVAVEFHGAIDRMYPPTPEDARPVGDARQAPDMGDDGQDIYAHSGGYVQSVGRDSLLELAIKHDVAIDSMVGFGDYVLPGNVLAQVHGGPVEDGVAKLISKQFVLGRNRLTDHDLLFAINQMAEIGVRALSPALNNPYTAVDAINRIGTCLAILISRPLPQEVFKDEAGTLRLCFPLPDFHHLLDAAFVPIRNYGRTSVMTMREMLLVIGKLATLSRRDVERRALAEHADAIRNAADHGLSEKIDIKRIHACFEQIERALNAVGAITPDYGHSD